MTPPQRCPLCGETNRCDPALRDRPCWCFTAAIDPAALERLPHEQRNRACLCPACAGTVPPAADTDEA